MLSLYSAHLYSQCSVKEVEAEGDLAYVANSESIYKNEDLENGILGAYFQLVVVENGNNKDLLKFACIIRVVSKRPKSPVVPRQVKLLFDDNTEVSLEALNVSSTQLTAGIIQNQCNYSFSSIEYVKFLSVKIKQIVIVDNRLNEQIVAKPYNGLIQQQAMCIADKML